MQAATFGGPIVKARIHFFQAAEGLRATISPTRWSWRLPQVLRELERRSRAETNQTFTRADLQLTKAVPVRYAWQSPTSQGCSLVTELVLGAGGIKQNRYCRRGHTWILSPRVPNEVHGRAHQPYHYRAHLPGTELRGGSVRQPRLRVLRRSRWYSFPSLSWGTSGNFCHRAHRTRAPRRPVDLLGWP
mgnify:CR=1 FL=1